MIKIKRQYVAIVLSLIVLILAITEQYTINKITDKIDKKIVIVENEINGENFAKARDISMEITKVWEKYSNYLDLFLNHNNVDDIGNEIYGIIPYINKEENYTAKSTLRKIKKQLISLKKSELPTFDNLI